MSDAARIPWGTQVGLQLHAGVVHFREDAPWLDELMAELLGFPTIRSIRFHKRSRLSAGVNLIGAASRNCGSESHDPGAPASQAGLGLLSGRESECGALISPCTGNTLEQPPNSQGTRLATFDNGFDDVRREIAKPQHPADMGIVELEAPGDFSSVPVLPVTKVPHPRLGAGDREHEPMVDPTRRTSFRNDDLLARTGPRGRQRCSVDLSIAVLDHLAGRGGCCGALADDVNLTVIDNHPLDVVSHEHPSFSAPAA